MEAGTEIFAIQQSKADTEFILKNGSLELDVLADIIETSEGVPFVGSMIELAKVGINAMDLRYVRKLAKYLKESNDIPQDKKDRYLNSLNEKDFRRISEMLSHLLYQAEEDS